MKKILCFDLDGTIVESSQVHIRAFQLAFEENGLPPTTDEQIIEALETGITARHVIKKLFPTISPRKLEAAWKSKNDAVENEFYKLAKEIPGVAGALEQLKQNYLLALVSNNVHKNALAILRGAGLSPKLFDLVLGAEDISRPKPAPDEIRAVESKLKSKVEYMVGDTAADIEAGKNAGVKTIAVLSGWGKIDELLALKPTIVLQSAALLAEVLLKKNAD